MSLKVPKPLTAVLSLLVLSLALPGISAAQNPVVLENQNPGSSGYLIEWGDQGDDVTRQVKGYASSTSINKGESIDLHISVAGGLTYTIDVYRLGWYNGAGARLMHHAGPLTGSAQPACPPNATTGLIECHWAVAYTLQTQASWTSGVYLVLLTNSQGKKNYIHFVVRDDSRASPLLFILPVMTYQAYNDYPYDEATGKSLYSFNSFGANTVGGLPAAVKVSFDRPYDGDGDSHIWGHNILNAEYAFIRWLERTGYDVVYGTDIDILTNPAGLQNYRGVIFPGHDEYWTKGMFDSVSAARDAGVNLGFFAANIAYTRVRMESSSTGVPNRIVTVYRDATIDPDTDPTLETVNLRENPINSPEQKLIGVQYTSMVEWHDGFFMPYKVINSGHWVYAGTGFHDGDTVKGLVGYEADRQYSEYAQPVSVPGTYQLLANSPFNGGEGPTVHQSSIYQAPSGAWVFGAGTMNWGFGLDDFNLSSEPITDARIQKMTQNILDAFSAGAAAGFSLAAGPGSQAVNPTGSASYTVTVSGTGGFNGEVTLSVAGLPADTTATFTPNPTTNTSTLNVVTGAGTPAGTYPLTITGVNGETSHDTSVNLVVQIQEFAPSISPATRTVPQSGNTTFALNVNPSGGFNSAVTFSVDGLPAGATGTFSPNPTTGATTLTVTSTLGTTSGTYPLTITGTGGGLTHTVGASLTISSSTGVVTVTAPNTAVSWKATAKQNITFTHNLGVGKQVNIDVSRDGGGSWNRITTFTTTSATSGSYPWTITGPATPTARIRVEAAENNTVNDVSDVDFTIVNPTITVTAPNTATSWQAGVSKNITFSHTMGTGQPVNIELSRDGGGTWSPIGSMTTTSSTSGTFAWVVTGPTTSAAQVRVKWATDSVVSDTSDVNFTITPRTKVSAPNTAVSWAAGSMRTVSWTHNLGVGGLVDIAFSADNGATWSVVTSNVPSSAATTGSTVVAMPLTQTTQARIRVTPSADPTSGDASDVSFTVAAPTLTVTAPNTNVAWTVGTTQSLKWSHNLGKLEPMKVEIARDGVNYTETINASVLNTADTSTTLSWVVTGPVTSTAKIRVTWINGGLSDDSNVAFRIR
jgi:hypothetical protein